MECRDFLSYFGGPSMTRWMVQRFPPPPSFRETGYGPWEILAQDIYQILAATAKLVGAIASDLEVGEILNCRAVLQAPLDWKSSSSASASRS